MAVFLTTLIGCVNDMIGQYKDVIVNNSGGVVTVVSDNNPGYGSNRVVVLKVGNCGHRLKFYYNGAMRAAILFTDGVSEYDSTALSSNAGVTFRLLIGAQALAFNCSDGLTSGLWFAKADTGNWYPGRMGNTIIDTAIDANVAMAGAGTPKDANGNIGVTRLLVSLGGVWRATMNRFYTCQDSSLANGNFYSDGTNNYLYCYGYLVSDAS